MNNENTFIKNDRFGLGLLNGLIFYDFLWPYIGIILLQIILQDNYQGMVENNYYTISLILMIITSLITLFVGILMASPKSLAKVLKKIRVKELKLIGKGLGLMMLTTFLYNFILVVAGIDITNGNANQNAVLELIGNNAVLSFISMIILAPLLEELTYRYFLYGGIAKYNRKAAIIASGVVFMCVHAVASFNQSGLDMFRELILLPPYMFSGIILAYSYDKTGNLLVPIAIHSLNNLISFILSLI